MPKKRRTSKVWNHFDLTDDGETAICKKCESSLSGKSMNGTSHLDRHFKSCKGFPTKAVSQPGKAVSRNETINLGLTKEGLVKKAIMNEIPIAHPSCKELWYDIIGPKLDIDEEICAYYKNEREKFATELTSRVSLSIKTWGEYISITAHLIDGEFNLVRKQIGFIDRYYVEDTLLEETSPIAHAIKSCLFDWKLDNKILSFQCSNEYDDVGEVVREVYSSKIPLSGKFVCIPPCAEKLGSYYNDSMGSDVVLKLFHNIKGFINSVKGDTCHLAAFNKIAGEKGLSPINVDWLNEYPGYGDYFAIIRMFKKALIYKDVFDQYFVLSITGQLGDGLENESNLCTIDWKMVECAAWHHEAKPPDLMSASNHPTSNLVFPNLVVVEQILNENVIDYFASNGESFKLFEIANALDPRYKLIFQECYWRQKLKSNWDSDKHKKLFEEVFSTYKNEEIIQTSPAHVEYTNREYQGSSSNFANLGSRTFDMFDKHVEEMNNQKKTELDRYLADGLVADRHDASFSLLGWWKQNRLQYPVLSRMARDILAVPTSSYDIEGCIDSYFEYVGDVSPELVEAVVCSKDWILSEEQSMLESNN